MAKGSAMPQITRRYMDDRNMYQRARSQNNALQELNKWLGVERLQALIAKSDWDDDHQTAMPPLRSPSLTPYSARSSPPWAVLLPGRPSSQQRSF
jgi:hypothetical protein